MTFKNPYILLLILLIPAIVFVYKQLHQKPPGINFPTQEFLKDIKDSFKVMIYRRIIILRLVIILFIIFALTRPQSMLKESKIDNEGIDIVLTLDSSTSMLAEDFQIGGLRKSRIDVIKEVVKKFIDERQGDRMSLVTFAATACTVSPMTLDHDWLKTNLSRIKTEMLKDGTAIGTGLMVSLNRLKNSKAKSKIIILLTDGRNNAGGISPLTAAQAAAALNIKIYCIGAGAKGMAPYPFQDLFGRIIYRNVEVDIDDDTLEKIANSTHAKYFRATDTQSLINIYEDINKLEKVPFEEKGYKQYKELFYLFLIPALILIFIEIILRSTVLKTIP